MATQACFVLMTEEGVADKEKADPVFKEHDDVFTLSDEEFTARYRLNKVAVREVCEAVREDLERDRVTRRTLSVEIQVLIALRFYATGAFLGNLATDTDLAMSTYSISNSLHAVSKAICNRLGHRISFPNTKEEKQRAKQQFYSLAGMPGCLGAIDGTYIAILSPPACKYRGSFRCHKGYDALNCMVVVDGAKRFTCVKSNSIGSNHDAFIWNGSNLRQIAIADHGSSELNRTFESGEWLLGTTDFLIKMPFHVTCSCLQIFYNLFSGDSGYPLEPWLMTPIANPRPGTGDEAYNRAHKKTRVVVEQAIGMWKARFRCLQRYRTLHFAPDRCTFIISACAILHNICIDHRLQDPEIPDSVADELAGPTVAFAEPSVTGSGRQKTWLDLGKELRGNLVRGAFTT